MGDCLTVYGLRGGRDVVSLLLQGDEKDGDLEGSIVGFGGVMVPT